MEQARTNVKEILSQIDKKICTSVSGWDAAITEAQRLIGGQKEKIAGVKRAIRAFEDLRDAGHPFPGDSGGIISQKGMSRFLPLALLARLRPVVLN
jgi:hypothetical protein